MDLKFSFGASNPLPLSSEGAGSASPAASSVLELRVRIDPQGTSPGAVLVCEGLSGDGVSYASATRSLQDEDPSAYAAALRSVLARGGAELPEPLLGSVTAIVLDLGGRELDTLEALGLSVNAGSSQLATVDTGLQARTGITAGTPIRVAE